jgi:hypothetical protein
MKLQVTQRNRKYLHLGFAIEFIILIVAIISNAHATPTNNENINKFCAYVVGIEYGSDNFTDKEYERFLYCTQALESND